jgi:hypothetical protein
MQRRQFMWILGGGIVAFEIGCHDSRHGLPGTPVDAASGADTTDATPDAAADGCQQSYVQMHDTYAQALDLPSARPLARPAHRHHRGRVRARRARACSQNWLGRGPRAM